ncbi:DHH family protein [Spiroplasma gladiatoris]|uniref:DHH family protein n=1 Tax=Spiroplasma gladiatoris TaxID=2143 RepID=A0A4P7AI90_9MOLU|nr:bifunctional oligoribonuclease/PAP phosphatase NrnA [Spiroplasma gladiatoris]QBQ08185.1 DHH family protein [Spiroplasma gladiatoris]
MFEKNNEKLIKKICAYQNIIIAKHESPDWDAQGSALALKEIILDNFKNKKVFVVGDSIDPETLLIDDEKNLTKEIIESALMITVDTANFERIDFKNKNLVKEIFKIDHHIKIDNYANEEIIDENAIACTQILCKIAYTNKWKVSKKAAHNLFFGLITDSNRFLFDKTSIETFEAAIFLYKCGVEANQIYNSLYLKDLKLASWLNRAFNKIEFVKNYPIAFIKIKKEDYENTNLSEEEIKSALSTMSGIKEIAIWFIAYESFKTKKIKLSIRSRDYNISKVANLYQGGGHKLASGAKLANEEEINNFIEDLKKLIDNQL